MKKKFIKIFLVFTVLFICLSFSIFLIRKKRKTQDKYNINILIQSCKGESLKNIYLAEILNLSKDKPINYYDFCIKKAEDKLRKNPFIKNAYVKKIKPSTVYVDYSLKKPIAKLLDFPNLALDKKGYVFPVVPFFKKKEIPEFYLGEENLFCAKNIWEDPIKHEKFYLALDIYNRLKDKDFFIKRIDVSNAFLENLGKREIVLILEHSINKSIIFPFIIRLNLSNYEKQLGNYMILSKKMLSDYEKQMKNMKNLPKFLRFSPKCIDMRIKSFAFIDEK